jgi:hypothetical protein
VTGSERKPVFGITGLRVWLGVRALKQPLQILNRQAGVGEYVAQSSFGYFAAWMNRDCRAATIGVAHHVVAACNARYLETRPL